MMQICLKSCAKKVTFLNRKYFTPVNEIDDRKETEKKTKQNGQRSLTPLSFEVNELFTDHEVMWKAGANQASHVDQGHKWRSLQSTLLTC